MKIRSGFVSNSSSSSFMVIGYKLAEKDIDNIVKNSGHKDIYEMMEDSKYKDYTVLNEDDGIEDGYYVIGVEAARWDESDYNDEISLKDINDIGDKIKNTFNIVDLDASIVVGTRYS